MYVKKPSKPASSLSTPRGLTSGSWTCAFCSEKFNMKRHLLDHMTKEHGAKGGVRCKICGAMVSCQSSLRRHMVNHTGEQRFQCTLCGKKFATKENYTGHMNVHAGAKPYQCKQCLKCFSYASQLSNHKRTCQTTVGGQMYWVFTYHYSITYGHVNSTVMFIT